MDGWKTSLSFWDGLVSMAMLNFQGFVCVNFSTFPSAGVDFWEANPAGLFGRKAYDAVLVTKLEFS